MQPGRERKLVTAALLAGMFLAALEATAVATAMPTAVADLSGMQRYSWAFSVYLLTSTTTVPLYGKLADLYGRMRIYLFGMAFFLAGSVLCGLATSFDQLILFRAIQGLGAGAVMPVSITLIGDIFTLEERARMQGVFSGVWGIASLIGPAVGGFVTDAFSWRFVFFFAVPFGILSAVLLKVNLREQEIRREHKLDLIGTTLLTASIAFLLIAILEGSEAWGWTSPYTLGFAALALISFLAFVRQERDTPEPTLPFDIFAIPVIAVASAGSIVLGSLLFTLTAFIPMYGQEVLGGSASQAGLPLIGMSIGWPIASTVAGRMMIRVGYRPLVLFGAFLAAAGTALLLFVSPTTPLALLILAMVVIGFGNGFVSTPYLVATQNAVPWNRRGVATSASQFFRTVGGCIATAALGALLNSRLKTSGLASALHSVFVACLVLALAGLIVALFFPAGSAQHHAHQTAG